jgi:predicted metal-binding membrane protein
VGAGPLLAAIARGPWPPLLLVSLAGWFALLAFEHRLGAPGYCGVSPGWPVWDWRGVGLALRLDSATWLVLPWWLMLVAMMPPLLAQPLTHLWHRSLARRRQRAIGLFVAAYAAVWMLAGPIVVSTAMTLRTLEGAVGLPALALAGAAALLWQVAPAKQSCLNRCHRLPRLSAFGLRADRDCLCYGVVAGLWCVGACWALMLVPLLAEESHAPLMAIIAILLLGERQAPARRAKWRIRLPIPQTPCRRAPSNSARGLD